MHISNPESKIEPLLQQGLFTSKEAREQGINPSLLCYYAKKGLIKKISYGLYQAKNTKIDRSQKNEQLLHSIKGVSNSVLCLHSALQIHNLANNSTKQIWLAIPNSTTKPQRENVTFKRMRDMKTGRVSIMLDEHLIETFDKERTILDLFREENKELALKILKKGLAKKVIDIEKLKSYAKLMRINITAYILALTI